MAIRRTNKRGFTLVEILIVVIILGILAAIVIPQFTNASTEARNSSARSLLQTVRSQVELYKLQHLDQYPLVTPGDITTAWDWPKMLTKTESDGSAGDGSADDVGPYLPSLPVNPLNSSSVVVSVADDATAAAGGAGGWVFSQETGKIFATNADQDGILAD